jgi:hypothetical protein
VQEVGEDLGEGALQLPGILAAVQLEESMHQAEVRRPVLVLVQNSGDEFTPGVNFIN